MDNGTRKEPQVTFAPGREYRSATRKFQGIVSVEATREGRLFATWYGGKTPAEDANNYVVLVKSDDQGETWSDELLAVDPDGEGPLRAFDPEIWLSPDGRLWLFWAAAAAYCKEPGVWCMVAENPDADEPQWSRPRRLTDGVMMCKPIVLSSGEWCLPASVWNTDGSARMVVSTDQGSSWAVRGAANIPPQFRRFDEHMIVERKDGTLWMLVRTTYGIGESVSTDRGYTWSEVSPSPFPHPSSRFVITRLRSGHLLLVKHGALEEKTGRSHLTAFLSEDDGKTWPFRLLLDERSSVSYPSCSQLPDQSIVVSYDFERTGAKEILFARFQESDVKAQAFVASGSKGKMLINQARGEDI